MMPGSPGFHQRAHDLRCEPAAEDQLLTGWDFLHPSGIMAAGNHTAQSFGLADIGGAGSTMLDLLRVSFLLLTPRASGQG